MIFTPFAFRKPKVIITGGLDPDAESFLTATGITDPTIEEAINTLVVDLKGYGLWSKMVAIYPFVGGTATTHKYNLKDPRDLDAAFRLVFNGGVTHSSNGVVGNGTTGYYDTKMTSNNITQNSVSMGVYTRNNVAEEAVDIGYLKVLGGISGLQLNTRDTSNRIFVRINSGTTQSVSNSDSRGFFSVNRLSSTTSTISKNTTQTSASVSSTTKPSGFPLYGLCFYLDSAPGASFFTTRQQSFSYIGQGLTDTELDNYYTAVQEFQTTLGRDVDTNRVLYYDMSNTNSYPGSGTSIFNLESTTLTSTMTNGASYSSTDGGVVVFDGTNDYTTGADNAILDFGTGDFTIEVWAKITGNSNLNASNQRSAALITAINKSGTLDGWNLTVRGDSTTTGTSIVFERQVSGTGQYPDYTFPSTLSKDTWYQLGISHSSTNGTKFIYNGTNNSASSNLSGNVNGNFALELGRLGISGYEHYLNGEIGVVKIYKGRQLSDAEILKNYNSETRFL